MTPSSTTSARIAAALHAVLTNLGNVPGEPLTIGPETSLPSLTRRALSILARLSEFPDRDSLAVAVLSDRGYCKHLIDSTLLSRDECFHAAETLARCDNGFTAGIIRAADEADTVESVMRALEVIRHLQRSNVAAHWIRRLSTHRDPRLQSTAVKMLASIHRNLSVIEKQFESSDARVRANAIEGAWGESSPNHRRLFERAALNPHHRVAANGLLGLYLADAPDAVERITSMAYSESALHRAASAWVMGETRCADFLEELERLRNDPEECVRSSALRGLAAFEQGFRAAADPCEVPVSH